jgi:phosphate transport system substrate-binding protein
MLRISATTGGKAFAPSVENVTSKTYPLARSLQVYTLGQPQGAVKSYIDWILSDAGQKIVEESGYVPLAPTERVKR